MIVRGAYPFAWWILVVGIAGGLCEGCKQQAERPKREKQDAAAGQSAAAQAAAPGGSVPSAAIVVDGRAEDWADVPVRLTNRPGSTSTYKPKGVWVARDGQYLYVLFELGLGVRERFEEQLPSGSVSSGALGYLNLTVDNVKYRLWLPTGVTMHWSRGAATPSFSLEMSYELLREKKRGEEYDKVLDKKYPSDKGWIGIAGKHVELKIPLEQLGAGRRSAWRITLDAF